MASRESCVCTRSECDGDCSDLQLVLEQACYYCQHRVIEGFMPEDISTFGVNPVLLAMAAMHSLITKYSKHEIGAAIQLLQFVHKNLPNPDLDLHMNYVDLLVTLKSKEVLYKVLSTYHFYDNKQREREGILDMHFSSEDPCAIPEGNEEAMEYYRDTHKSVYDRIMNVLSNPHLCKNFQQVLLSSQETWEGLVNSMEKYVAKIRNLLPLPQFVQRIQAVPCDSGTSAILPKEEFSFPDTKISLRQPCVYIHKLPIRLPHHVDSTSSEDSDNIAYPRRRRSYIKHFMSDSSSDYNSSNDYMSSGNSSDSIVSDSEAPVSTSYRKEHATYGYSQNTNTAASVSYYIDDSSTADETDAVMESENELYKSAMLLRTPCAPGTKTAPGGDTGSQSDESSSPSSLRMRVSIPSGGELSESEGLVKSTESGGLAESCGLAESEGLAEVAESGGLAKSAESGGLAESAESERLAESGGLTASTVSEKLTGLAESSESRGLAESEGLSESGKNTSKRLAVSGDDHDTDATCEIADSLPIVDEDGIDWENWEQKETTCINMQDASDQNTFDSNDENQDASDHKMQDASDHDSNSQDTSDTQDGKDLPVSPSLFSTPNQPTVKSSKPHPKEVRMTLSTTRLKSFLHVTSGEEPPRLKRRMRVEKKTAASHSEISKLPLVSAKMSNPNLRLPVATEEDSSMVRKDSPKVSSSPIKTIASIVDQSVLCTLQQHGEQAKDRDHNPPPDTHITVTACTTDSNRDVDPSPLSSVDAALIDAAESPIIHQEGSGPGNKKRALVSYSLCPNIEKSPKKRRGRPPKIKTLPPVQAVGKRKRGRPRKKAPEDMPSGEIRRHKTPPSRESGAQVSAVHLPKRRGRPPKKYQEPDFMALKLPSTVLTPTITDEDVSMGMSEPAQESPGDKNVIGENVPISSQDKDLGFHPINEVDIITDTATSTTQCEEMATTHFPLVNTKVTQAMPNLSEHVYSLQPFSSPEIPILTHQTQIQRDSGVLTKFNPDVLKEVFKTCPLGELKQLHGIITDLVMQQPSDTAKLAQNSTSKSVSPTITKQVSSLSSSAQVVEEQGQELEVVSDSTADTDTEYSGHQRNLYLPKLSLSKRTSK